MASLTLRILQRGGGGGGRRGQLNAAGNGGLYFGLRPPRLILAFLH